LKLAELIDRRRGNLFYIGSTKRREGVYLFCEPGIETIIYSLDPNSEFNVDTCEIITPKGEVLKPWAKK